MTDRELDALVAEKLMGPVAHETHPDQADWFCLRCGVEQGRDRPCRPSYSTDIAAAWAVVEEMRGHWKIEIDYAPGVTALYNGDMGEAFASAATAPRAICLAALKAVGVVV